MNRSPGSPNESFHLHGLPYATDLLQQRGGRFIDLVREPASQLSTLDSAQTAPATTSAIEGGFAVVLVQQPSSVVESNAPSHECPRFRTSQWTGDMAILLTRHRMRSTYSHGFMLRAVGLQVGQA